MTTKTVDDVIDAAIVDSLRTQGAVSVPVAELSLPVDCSGAQANAELKSASPLVVERVEVIRAAGE